jgi:phospholipid-transporting ATPase
LKILSNSLMTDEFYELATNSSVVIACRVSPMQKAQIVTMVRHKNNKCISLAIGDGANDVNMITSAHIGVGISGLEGQAAARASDYAIGQFKFLKPLMFFHGRECYRRNSYTVGYMFYKNVLLVFPIFFFGLMSLFSGQAIYENYMY